MALFIQPREFFHFTKSDPRGYFHPAPSKFSISKIHTTMALFTLLPRFSRFQKILPPWLFSARPLAIFAFKKSYLNVSSPLPTNFSISKNLSPVALFSQPPHNFPFQKIIPQWLFSPFTPEIFHFITSYHYGSFQPTPLAFFHFKKSYPHGSYHRPLEIFHFKQSYLHDLKQSYLHSLANFSISQNLTLVALFSQPLRNVQMQREIYFF